MLEEDRPAEEYREAIGNALLEIRHLARLSQNLLFLARGQAGRITLSFANVDLVKFVSDVTRDLQPAATDREIDLAAELPDDPVRAFIDADRMQQVLHNLLENAIRYTEPAGRVRVKLLSHPSEAIDRGRRLGNRDPARATSPTSSSGSSAATARAGRIPAAPGSASRSCAGSSTRTREPSTSRARRERGRRSG